MIYTSNKPQAKRIFEKNNKQAATASQAHVFFLLLKATSNKQPDSSLLPLYFFLFEKATSNKQRAAGDST